MNCATVYLSTAPVKSVQSPISAVLETGTRTCSIGINVTLRRVAIWSTAHEDLERNACDDDGPAD